MAWTLTGNIAGPSGASIVFDTDGVPYVTDVDGSIAFDTDGVPYLTIGA